MAAALLAAGCGHRRAHPARPAPQAEVKKPSFEPKINLSGISWSLPDTQGRPLWQVTAQKGTGEVAGGIAELSGVQCKVYADGQQTLEATAPRVTADRTRKEMQMEGGVTARSLDGTRSFRADRLKLTTKEEKRVVLEATGAVHLEMDGMVGSGQRLVTDAHLTQGELSNR